MIFDSRIVLPGNRVILPEQLLCIADMDNDSIQALATTPGIWMPISNARIDSASPWCYTGTEQRIYNRDIVYYSDDDAEIPEEFVVFFNSEMGLWDIKSPNDKGYCQSLYLSSEDITFTGIVPWEGK